LKKTILPLFFILPILILAQQHPLTVESAELIEPGHAKAALGIAHFRNQPFPLSGLTGNLSKFGNLQVAVSLSEFVELKMEGTALNLLYVTKRDSAFNSIRTTRSNPTGDIGDFTVWTKFGVLNEYRTGIGFSVHFGVQLPNASNESGLGIDEMNFYSALLFQKHFAGRWNGNVGLGILSDPTILGQQHDVLIYGLAYELPVSSTTSAILQTSGRSGHSGIGIQRLANATASIEESFGNLAVTFSGIVNFSPADNAKGISLSVSYLFHVVDIRK